MARKSLIGTLLAALAISACATPERVNNPRVFDDTAGRLTRTLSGEGLQFSYGVGNRHAIFPSSVHSERSLEEWHRLLQDGNLVPPDVDPEARPTRREMFEREIAAARYESAIDNLVWVVFSHDRLLKLKLIDLRNTITISRAASSALRQSTRLLDVMNRNPDFFDAADFSVIRGAVARLAAVRDEAIARREELEADICSGEMSCNSSVLGSAARSFTRRLQHDMFLAGYPDGRYVGHLTQEVRALRASRNYELYYFSFNAEAEAARVLRLEQSLARVEERLLSQQQFSV